MLISLGKRGDAPATLRDRLLDCHARIRKFCALARRLAEGGPADEVREAANAVHRYFAVGLPLHVRDEDESLAPRLRHLADPDLAGALDVMSHEHAVCDELLARLLPAWRALADAPDADACAATADCAAALERHLLAHIGAEEERVMPTLERLQPSEQDEIVAEMKARREPSQIVAE